MATSSTHKMAQFTHSSKRSRTSSPHSTPSRPLPLHDIPCVAFDALDRMPRQSLLRPTKSLSYELANHSKAYLEAEQYAAGFEFLTALLTTGASVSTPAKPHYALIPPPPQLSLASTLVVYPATTTKSRSHGTEKGADAALRYLRTVLTTISPLDPALGTAFAFPDERSRRRTATRHNTAASSPVDGGDIEHLAGLAANSHALLYCATDFWHIVGWAFNCSVAHKKRWKRWKLWLEVMLDLVESEWEARVKLSRSVGARKDSLLMDSLIWLYLASEDPSNRSNRRRVIRAIFATATAQSKAQFPEVWHDEPADPKPMETSDAVQRTNIDNWELGDFEQVDEDAAIGHPPALPTRAASTRRSARGKLEHRDVSPARDDALLLHNAEEATERLGGMAAIVLRQRLIALLARVAQALPGQFTKLNDLFDSIGEILNPLPSLMFSILLSTSRLPGPAQMALSANLILPLTSGGEIPDYTVIAPAQDHLEFYLLPRRATTQSFAANAKISFILEQMLNHMMSTKALKASDDLRKALETGIKERHKVYGTARGKKGNAHEEGQAKRLMEASSERLLGLLEVLEISQGKSPQLRKKELLSFSSMISDELSSPPSSGTEEWSGN